MFSQLLLMIKKLFRWKNTETENQQEELNRSFTGIVAEYSRLVKLFQEEYIVGFSAGGMFLINKTSLVPTLAIYIRQFDTYIYTNLIAGSPKDAEVIFSLMEAYPEAKIEQITLAYDEAAQCIVTGSAAEEFLSNKSVIDTPVTKYLN